MIYVNLKLLVIYSFKKWLYITTKTVGRHKLCIVVQAKVNSTI